VLAMQQSIDVSCRLGPQQQTLCGSVQQLNDGTDRDGSTDRQTPYHYINPIQHTMQAVLINMKAESHFDHFVQLPDGN